MLRAMYGLREDSELGHKTVQTRSQRLENALVADWRLQIH